jgi:archaemetzincin
VKNIILVPLTTMLTLDYLEDWSSRIARALGEAGVKTSIIIWPEILQPPMKCYDWGRMQYYSPCLLRMLTDMFGGLLSENYVLGVGYLDAYDDGLNFVFGEASPAMSTGIVYTRRLDPRFYGEPPDWNKYVERVAKELIHELGHLLGLGHCNNPGCVMSFSNSIREVDRKSMFFCRECSWKIRRMLNV